VKIAARNDSNGADRSIRVRIVVRNGQIHKNAKPPKRPIRVDGVKQINWGMFLISDGFWRSRVRITAHAVEAKFSRLAAHDGAYVVNEPIYIQSTPDTELTYTVSSRNLPQPQTGSAPVVELPAR
jgi:glutathione synthase/RimK-type ligase-like ATP-grasp enzyme